MTSCLPAHSRYRVIVNPWAGRGNGQRLLPQVRGLLQGLPHDLVLTEAPRHATALAAAAADEGYEVVVAVGGDGTNFEVLNGLAGRETAMAFLPIGSGNDLIKPLGIPRDLAGAARRLREGRVRRIDLGRVGDTYFGNGLGVGFDARVALESYRLPRLRGLPLYMAAIWRAVWRFHSPALTIHYDGREIQGRFMMANVANGRCLAAGFWLTPQAEMDDGLLDLCLVADMPLPIFFYHLPKVLRGRHTHLREVTMLRARRVTVEAQSPVPMHADGEVLDEAVTSLGIEVVPGALRVLC